MKILERDITNVELSNKPGKSIKIVTDTLTENYILLDFQYSAAYFEGPKMAILTTSKDDNEECWHSLIILNKIPNTDRHIVVNIFHDYEIQQKFFPNVILSDILYEDEYHEFLKLQFQIF